MRPEVVYTQYSSATGSILAGLSGPAFTSSNDLCDVLFLFVGADKSGIEEKKDLIWTCVWAVRMNKLLNPAEQTFTENMTAESFHGVKDEFMLKDTYKVGGSSGRRLETWVALGERSALVDPIDQK